MGILRPLTSRLQKLLNVIGTNTDCLATCDFLLVIRNNHGSIVYCFGDRTLFLVKIKIFFYPLYANGVPLQIL